MLHASFDIELDQPLIISQQAASAGAHQSLDYVPGSVLLGLAASRMYASLDAGSAWTLFHSGLVRFGDALPLDAGGDPGYPLPLCWHSYKGVSAEDRGRLLAGRLFDPSLYNCDPARQPVQLRGGYTTASGLKLAPAREHTLKTAIDRHTGMAAESQLFGYEALSPGQRFLFTVSADAGIAPALWDALRAQLSGVARLGRSRSAQFGQVRIQARAPAGAPAIPDDGGHELTLWLLSELLLEECGQPCLCPHPQLLGLPPGSEWLTERSFLRSRRYSTYNAYRRHYDSERQVICRGSVLRYRLSRPLTDDERLTLQQGLGLQIEAGLGATWVNPPLLAHPQPQFAAAAVEHHAPAPAPQRPASPLIAALEQRRQRRNGDAAPERHAHALFDELCQRIHEARRYAALAVGVPLEEAPGRSQWGRLKQLASDHRHDPAALWHALTDARDGVIRSRSGRALRYGPEPGQQLDAWLLQTLEPHRGHGELARLIGHLAALGLQQAWLDCCAGKDQQCAKELET